MTNRDVRGARARGDGDRISEARREARRQRKARRHAFWSDLADSLLSLPAAIAMRLGG